MRKKHSGSEPVAERSMLPVPDYIAFDLETTGLSPDDDEILEVAFIRFEDGEPVERWSTLLNPGRPVPLKTLRLTHIELGDIEQSPAFEDVCQRLMEMCESLPLVGHNASFDTAFLQRRLEGFPRVPVYDTLELSRIVFPGYKTYKLGELAQALGIPLKDAHRAYDDAEVAGKVFALLQKRILAMDRWLRETVVSIMGDGWVPGRLFAFEETGPSMRPLFRKPGALWPELPGSAHHGEDLAGSEESAGPGKEPGCGGDTEGASDDGVCPDTSSDKEDETRRLGARLAEILDSVDHGVCVVDAPLTVPLAGAVARAIAEWSGRTGGRALLAGFPDAHLPAGIPRTAFPEDYICLWKFNQALALAGQGFLRGSDVEDRRFLAALAVWLHTTGSGDMGEVQVAGRAHVVRAEISCPRDMRCRHACPQKDACRYLLAEKRSGSSPVRRASLYRAVGAPGGFDRVIVWDAQELQRIWQYRDPRVDLLVLKETLASAQATGAIPAVQELLTTALRDLSAGVASAATVRAAAEAKERLAEAVSSLRERLEKEYAFLTEGESEWEGRPDPPLVFEKLHYLERACEALSAFLSPSPGEVQVIEPVYAGEVQGAAVALRTLWPAQEAVKAIRSSALTVILSDVALQAASSAGGRRLVLGTDAHVLSLGERPRDHGRPSHLVLWSVDTKAPASGPGFLEYASGLIRRLVSKVRKGLLVLVPSRAQLREIYEALSPELEREGVAVYAQGIDGGHRIVEHLDEEDSMVLAYGWSPGEDGFIPACLVVTKVPFAPPNPVDSARRRELSGEGLDGFVEVSVRPAALTIRTYAERMLAGGGRRALILADPRVSPGGSKWAGEFLRSLEGFPRECGPVEYVLNRVSRHLSGES